MGPNPLHDEHTLFRDHVVLDPRGEKVGTVTDVVYDDVSNEPKLLVVDPGRLSAAHFVPLDGAAIVGDGTVQVPFDKDVVKRSPKAKRDHILTSGDLREIDEHYGLVSR